MEADITASTLLCGNSGKHRWGSHNHGRVVSRVDGNHYIGAVTRPRHLCKMVSRAYPNLSLLILQFNFFKWRICWYRRRLRSRQLRAGVDIPVTDRLAVMSASAVPELQHGQPIPSYSELSSLKTGVVGDGRPGSVSHGGLLIPTCTLFRTSDTLSAGGMNDYW